MTVLERLKMEIKNLDVFIDDELKVYLEENDLTGSDNYDPSSNVAKRKIYLTALSVLESLANDPQQMKSVKKDNMSVSQFHENLMQRIDALERKIRMMVYDTGEDSSFFSLFAE